MRTRIWFLAFAFAALACIVSLFAQTNGPVATPGSGIQLGAFGQAQIYIDLGTLVIGTLITAGWKKWGPLVNPRALPFLATGIAILAGGLLTVTVGDGVDSWKDIAKTVILALANVTLRELKENILPEDRDKPGEPS